MKWSVILCWLLVAGTLQADPLVISHLPPGYCDLTPGADLVISTAQTVDALGCSSHLSQSATPGVSICVVDRNNITITSTGTLTLGSERALLLIGHGNVLIQGTVDASRNSNATLSNAGQTGSAPGKGGSGGGARTNGGLGGGGANGGAAVSGDALFPGGVGGATSTSSSSALAGGGLQIVACGDLVIASTGRVLSNGKGGAGGAGGSAGFGSGHGGHGGGAGGDILLESNSLSIAGTVASNGGSGGAGGAPGGAASSGLPGPGGVDGGVNTTPAPGGSSAQAGGSGGAGGAGNSAPGNGMDSPSMGAGAGGGGGAAGRVIFRSCTGSIISPGAVVSPAAQTGTSCQLVFRDGFES